ncbi:MAG: Hint domain-containing protein [Defluviimonas sp.]|uniref:Hint domain-containing protein n=1 Tax=Albidovulum sp. TaxID=1872424 RepID=UPI002A259A0F|nr:Hint domain-containing protein [Defluviimonas sp.]
MPTSYTDQFFLMDPGNPPAAGTALTPGNYGFVDQDDDGNIGTGSGDTFNGATVINVWRGDTITVTMGGSTVTVSGVTFYVDDGAGGFYSVFTPTDGTILQDAVFRSSTWVSNSTQVPVGTLTPACFVKGTRIRTPQGPRPVEDLAVGDLVTTSDHGDVPIRWIGNRTVIGRGRFAPIRFERDAIGNESVLSVSPQHRILVSGWRAELLFGCGEVLVPAKALVNDTDIRPCPCNKVHYFHLLFDEHEIVFSEGVSTESFHPGAAVLDSDPEMREELAELFPELAEHGASWPTARHAPRLRDGRLLAPRQDLRRGA